MQIPHKTKNVKQIEFWVQGRGSGDLFLTAIKKAVNAIRSIHIFSSIGRINVDFPEIRKSSCLWCSGEVVFLVSPINVGSENTFSQ